MSEKSPTLDVAAPAPSIEFFSRHHLPLGPFTGTVELLGRRGGRRLHLHERCSQYRRTSSKHTPVTINVPANTIIPARHLCHECSPQFDRWLVSSPVPGGDHRRRHSTHARTLVDLRSTVHELRSRIDQSLDELDQQLLQAATTNREQIADDTQQDTPAAGAPVLPDPQLLQEVLTCHSSATDLAQDCRPGTSAEELTSAIEHLIAELDNLQKQFQDRWNNPAGDLAATRWALLNSRQLLRNPKTSTQPWFSTGAGATSSGDTAAVPDRRRWSHRALVAAFASWQAQIRRGASPAQCARAAQSAACQVARQAAPEAGAGIGVPVYSAPTPGQTVHEYLLEQLLEHARTLAGDWTARWEALLEMPTQNPTVIALRGPSGTLRVIDLATELARSQNRALVRLPDAVAAAAGLRYAPASEAVTHALSDPAVAAATLTVLRGAPAMTLTDAAEAASAICLPCPPAQLPRPEAHARSQTSRK